MQIQELLQRYQRGERDFAHVDLSGATLIGVDLREINLTGANLTGANLAWAVLSRSNLTGACLRQADLRSAIINNANLKSAILTVANLTKADLRFAQLQQADLNWALLREADLSSADLQQAKLDRTDLEKAKLNNTQLSKAELMEANLRRASLINANLTGANLREAHLEGANLQGCIFVGSNLTEANLSGVCLRNANLSQADLHRSVLTGADMSDALLNGADLSRANLANAYLLKTSLQKAYLLRTNLQDVYLLRADLSEANLRGASLQRADLSGAYLSDTSLSEANLSGAYLIESRLIRTNLTGAKLTGTCIYNWHLEDVDVSEVECRYVFTQYNYANKQPWKRYPEDRDLQPGELALTYEETNNIIEVNFQQPPDWQALVFSVSALALECHDLNLEIKSYELTQEQYLLRLAANRLVNAKILRDRFLQLYAQMQERLVQQRKPILALLDIKEPQPVPQQPPLPPSIATSQPNNTQQPLYQEVLHQIEYILKFQSPENLMPSLQRLLDYLQRQGLSTEKIPKQVIIKALVARAKQDKSFHQYLLQWEKAATSNGVSPLKETIKSAISLLGFYPYQL